MVNLESIGSVAGGALMSWLTWLLIGVLILALSFGGLYMRKKGKFRFPAVIIQDNGNGKVNVIRTKAGWFKSKKILRGLYDYSGERRLEIKDGRLVQKGSSADFHELNYKSGLILVEKSNDPKILLPIERLTLTKESQDIIAKIAPADYRDASSKIISETEKESSKDWTTIAQLLVFGFVGVILFVSIILVIQYVKNTMMEAQQIHREALAFYQKAIERTSAVPSSAP